MPSASFRRPPTQSPNGLGQAGPATVGLVTALVVCSVVGAVLDRQMGQGASRWTYDRDAILAGELWRGLTYAFVVVGAPLNLFLSAGVLYLFGRSFEQRWGSRRYLTFCLLSFVGAATLAVPFGLLLRATGLFQDQDLYGGPDAAINALLVALALEAPNTPILFGFVLPMRARTFLFVLLAMEAVGGLMTGGVTGLGLSLGGMAMGYVLSTGLWRPQVLLARVRLWRLRRRRRGLYVVPPRATDFGGSGRQDKWLN